MTEHTKQTSAHRQRSIQNAEKANPSPNANKVFSQQKLRRFFIKAVRLLLNPRFLLCFGIAWFITNGWSYVALGMGTYFKIPWLTAVATGYLALLWIPFTPEKLITATIAIALLRLLFPQDEKTLGQLRTIYQSAKEKWKAFRERHLK